MRPVKPTIGRQPQDRAHECKYTKSATCRVLPKRRGSGCGLDCLSFGGPAGQIALLHREVVDERNWVSDRRFLHALNFCTLLPGPEAQQLATYLGWLMHGASGRICRGDAVRDPRDARSCWRCR